MGLVELVRKEGILINPETNSEVTPKMNFGPHLIEFHVSEEGDFFIKHLIEYLKDTKLDSKVNAYENSYTHLFIKGNKNAAKAVVLYEI